MELEVKITEFDQLPPRPVRGRMTSEMYIRYKLHRLTAMCCPCISVRQAVGASDSQCHPSRDHTKRLR